MTSPMIEQAELSAARRKGTERAEGQRAGFFPWGLDALWGRHSIPGKYLNMENSSLLRSLQFVSHTNEGPEVGTESEEATQHLCGHPALTLAY